MPTARDTRIQADALASALELGAATVDDVVKWADAVVEQEPNATATLPG